MKQRVRDGAAKCRRGGSKAKRGFVFIITSDSILQAIMTSSLTAVILSTNEGVSAYIARWLSGQFFFIPTKLIAAIGATLLFFLAYYAKMNPDEWRDTVRAATGEDEAVDKAESDDELG